MKSKMTDIFTGKVYKTVLPYIFLSKTPERPGSLSTFAVKTDENHTQAIYLSERKSAIEKT